MVIGHFVGETLSIEMTILVVKVIEMTILMHRNDH
jgi:hypothetical protein